MLLRHFVTLACVCKICIKKNESLIYFKQALEIKNNALPDQKKDSTVARTLQNNGLCFLNLHRYDEALIYY